METERLSAELLTLIGEDALYLLAEAFGGTRLYVPAKVREDGEIAMAIGLPAAQKLSDRYAPDVLRIPLCRSLRAVRYRAMGRSNASIARLLGMGETGVDKLFKRIDEGTSPLVGRAG